MSCSAISSVRALTSRQASQRVACRFITSTAAARAPPPPPPSDQSGGQHDPKKEGGEGFLGVS